MLYKPIRLQVKQSPLNTVRITQNEKVAEILLFRFF